MRFLLPALSVVLFMSLSSCDSNSNDQPRETVIGLAAPLTGSLARAGQNMRLASEMTIALANESLSEGMPPFRLLVEDTKSTSDGTEEAFQNLITNGVRFIVGPFTSANTGHAIPLIDESRVVTIAPASAASGLAAESEWLFRSSLTVDILMPEGVRATHDFLKYEHVATLTNQADRFSLSARDKFIGELAKIGGATLDVQETFSRFDNQGVPDMDSQIRSLLNTTPKLDALFFFGQAPDRYHFILKAYELGLHDVPFIIPLLSTSEIRLARETNPLATEGIFAIHVWVSGSTHLASQKFVEAYQKRYNDTPNDQHARTYAAMVLLMRAIEDAIGVGNSTSEAVRERLAGMRNVNTIYGSFSFDANGDADYTPLVGIVRGSNIELLEDN